MGEGREELGQETGGGKRWCSVPRRTSCWCLVFGVFSWEGMKWVSACWPSFSQLTMAVAHLSQISELVNFYLRLLYRAVKKDIADNWSI